MEKANLKKWILDLTGGEKIEGVVIGRKAWEDDEEADPTPKNKLMSWEDASKWLDYSFDDGFGCAECHAVFAWTKSWVIFISEYDGSTTPSVIPRHPVDCRPDYDGLV